MPWYKEVVVLYAAVNGYLDILPLEKIAEWESGFLKYVEDMKPEIFSAMKETGDLEEKTEDQLKKALEEFTQNA